MGLNIRANKLSASVKNFKKLPEGLIWWPESTSKMTRVNQNHYCIDAIMIFKYFVVLAAFIVFAQQMISVSKIIV